MRKLSGFSWAWGVLAAVAFLAASSDRASALDFEIPTFGFGDQPISAVLNTTLTAGGGFRTQGQSVNLIGKSNLNPGVCGGPNGAYQSCQGLFRDQSYPAAQLAAAPGAAQTADAIRSPKRHRVHRLGRRYVVARARFTATTVHACAPLKFRAVMGRAPHEPPNRQQPRTYASASGVRPRAS